MYDSLQLELKDNCYVTLVNIGSCGLHQVYGVFQNGQRLQAVQLTDSPCQACSAYLNIVQQEGHTLVKSHACHALKFL